MRTLISFLIGIVTAAFVVGLRIFVDENRQGDTVMFLGTTFQGNKGFLMAGAVALGFLLAFLLFVPGRLASARHRWSLGRQTVALEERLRALREEHAELQGSHRRLLEEHQKVMQQVLTPVATTPLHAPGTLVARAVPATES
jgi:hypothetical protein